jgi:hypothetical protein
MSILLYPTFSNFSSSNLNVFTYNNTITILFWPLPSFSIQNALPKLISFLGETFYHFLQDLFVCFKRLFLSFPSLDSFLLGFIGGSKFNSSFFVLLFAFSFSICERFSSL